MSLIKIAPYIIDSTLDFTFNNVTSTGTVVALTANVGNINTTGNVNFTGTSNVTLGAIGNLHISGGSNGQVLTTNGSGGLSWATAATGGGSGGGASVTVSDTAPSSPSQGDMWLDSESGDLNVYYSGAWGSVTETAPQFITTVNSFTGDSLTTNFTLTTTPVGKEYTLVAIGGVLQPKSTYSLSGNVITTSSPVPSNTPIEITVLGGQATTVNLASVVTQGVQSNITSVGTLTSLTVTGDASITGNANVSGNLAVTGNLTINGAPPSTTGKSIAMAIVFGF